MGGVPPSRGASLVSQGMHLEFCACPQNAKKVLVGLRFGRSVEVLRSLRWCHQDAVSDHPERFFVGEIVREKIFQLYREEIPYCSTVCA